MIDLKKFASEINYWAEGKYDKVQIHGPHHPTNSLSSLPLLDQFSKVNRIAYI